MKKWLGIALVLTGIGWVIGACCFASDLKDAVKGISDAVGGVQDKKGEPKKSAVPSSEDTAKKESGSEKSQSVLDETTSINGIKEALVIGVQTAVTLSGVQDGFYKNDNIKILMPKKLQKADKALRQIGGDQMSDMLVEKMNRAAEKAVPEAEKIFIDAIKNMKIEDTAKILNGGSDSATAYLKEKTSESLSSSFYPIIQKTMEELDVVKTFNEYAGRFSSNPLLQVFDLNVDISRHVTDSSISGLFKMVAEQEKEIRKNPAARVTDLLKTVFGGR